MSTHALDDALHRLGRHSTVDQRLAVLRQLIEYWDGPIGPASGYSAEELKGIQMPLPLRWWFKTAGHRQGLMSGQNLLLAPDELRLDDDGRLLFYIENQGVYLWSTTLIGDDPPVWGRVNEGHIPWSVEGMTLSEFLIGACLFQTVIGAPFGASAACADQCTLDRITAEIPPLPIVPWRWPANPSRFYAKNGAFMFVSPNFDNHGNEAFSIWVSAKTRQPLSFLKQIVDKEWEHTTL